MILLTMKITSPSDDFLEAIVLAVILGSNKVMATTVEIKTKMDVKKRVMLAWMRCSPSKQTTVGKKDMTCTEGSLSEGPQLMILSRN